MGVKEVVINLQASNAALRKQLADCKRLNTKLRQLALHIQGAECFACRSIVCPDRERLFRDALGRSLLNLRNPPR